MGLLSNQPGEMGSLWAGDVGLADPRRVKQAALTIESCLVQSILHHGVKHQDAIPALTVPAVLAARRRSDAIRPSTTAETSSSAAGIALISTDEQRTTAQHFDVMIMTSGMAGSGRYGAEWRWHH